MHATILYSLALAALLLPCTVVGVMPSELVPRACHKQAFDPKGILCSQILVRAPLPLYSFFLSPDPSPFSLL